jgi:hypothetical protein
VLDEVGLGVDAEHATLHRPDPQRAERRDEIARRPGNGERRLDRARPRVELRDGAGAVVRVQHPHPLVRGGHLRRRASDRHGVLELPGGCVDHADRVRRRDRRVARSQRQGEHRGDRHPENRSTGRDEASPRAATPTTQANGRKREAERGTGVVDERVARLVPLSRLLRERAAEHRIERRVRRQLRRVLLHVRPEGLGLGRTAERGRAGEKLVEDAGERVLVGAAVELPAADLLRGEVVQRPRQGAGSGYGVACCELRGEPEVGEVAVARSVDEDIRRLHVAMDETAGVRGVERVRDLTDDRERLLRRERTACDDRAQVVTVHEPVREVELALRLPGGVDREDAGMVDRGREP